MDTPRVAPPVADLGGEIVIVSGSYGAGHDAAADALALQLRASGRVVRRLDVADELPWRIGSLLRWIYFTQLMVVPGSWGVALRCLQRDGLAARATRWALGVAGRRLVRGVADADLVISTHPFASQALGEARRLRRLERPVVTYLTDASVHRLWVHTDVDLHLAMHETTAAQARALGGATAVVAPAIAPAGDPIPPGWIAPWSTELPAALVVGGSCGIGDLEASARDLAATGLVTPVVACGTNERLRARLSTLPGVVALGWRDDMAALVDAASCVVQNAGGMTSLEALSAGTPTLSYRPIAGHGTTNALALEAAGLVPWVRSPAELADALAGLLTRARTVSLPQGALSVVETLERRFLALPVPETATAA